VSTPSRQPLLRVIRGEPTDDELAALVAVVTTRAAVSAERRNPAVTSRWAAPRPRPALRPGPGAWVAGVPRP
jgi:hypothetical protein